jgi:hypothetical protein
MRAPKLAVLVPIELAKLEGSLPMGDGSFSHGVEIFCSCAQTSLFWFQGDRTMKICLAKSDWRLSN